MIPTFLKVSVLNEYMTAKLVKKPVCHLISTKHVGSGSAGSINMSDSSYVNSLTRVIF